MPYFSSTNKYLLPIWVVDSTLPKPDISGSKEKQIATTVDFQLLGLITGHNKLINGVLAEGVFLDNITGNTFKGRVFNHVADISTLGSPVLSNAPIDPIPTAFEDTVNFVSLADQLAAEIIPPSDLTLKTQRDDLLILVGSLDFVKNTGLTVFIDKKLGFVRTSAPLYWPVNKVQDQFLYVRPVEKFTSGMFLSTFQFNDLEPYVLSTLQPQSLLVAFRPSGVNSLLDINPVGKVTILTVADHAAINQNPHGTSLSIGNQVITSGLSLFGTVTVNTATFTNKTIIDPNSVVTQHLLNTIQNDVVVSGNLTVNQSTTLTLVSGVNVLNLGQTVTKNLLCSGAAFLHDIKVSSGITVDTLDFTTLVPLINGSTIKKEHIHSVYAPRRSKVYAPRFGNFGVLRSDPLTGFYDHEHPETHDTSLGMLGASSQNIFYSSGIVSVGMTLPHGFKGWKDIGVRARVDFSSGVPVGTNKIILGLNDTLNNPATFFASGTVVGNSGVEITNQVWESHILSGINGTWNVGDVFHLIANMYSVSGSDIDLGAITLNYLV